MSDPHETPYHSACAGALGGDEAKRSSHRGRGLPLRRTTNPHHQPGHGVPQPFPAGGRGDHLPHSRAQCPGSIRFGHWPSLSPGMPGVRPVCGRPCPLSGRNGPASGPGHRLGMRFSPHHLSRPMHPVHPPYTQSSTK